MKFWNKQKIVDFKQINILKLFSLLVLISTGNALWILNSRGFLNARNYVSFSIYNKAAAGHEGIYLPLLL